jgi:hypothetical protein
MVCTTCLLRVILALKVGHGLACPFPTPIPALFFLILEHTYIDRRQFEPVAVNGRVAVKHHEILLSLPCTPRRVVLCYLPAIPLMIARPVHRHCPTN